MNLSALNWKSLERLRRAFLEGVAGGSDYWHDADDVSSYDATFAQRIGWKWDFALEELARLGWQPPGGSLLDWGCGSGIAHRAFLDHFGVEAASELWLADRSHIALRYAAVRARERFPQLTVHTGQPPTPSLVLLSHVLTELDESQTDRLVDLVRSAMALIWVEPGTHQASRALIGVRERLSPHFNIISPCTHQAACGLFASGNERHWCHHFAPPPPHVFTDSDWTRFANMMEIDLRSVPLSYLVLDRRPVPAAPGMRMRVIGRPRLDKHSATLFACDAAGVRDTVVEKRRSPGQYKALKKGFQPGLIHVRAGDEPGIAFGSMDDSS